MKNHVKFRPNFEKILDDHFESLLTNQQLSVPGLVVLARRGTETYHKAFGMSDLKSGKKMQTDAIFLQRLLELLLSYLFFLSDGAP